MALTTMQKKWAVGGGIGAATLFVGYWLFHSRPAFGQSALHDGSSHAHKHRKKRRHDQGQENSRGEYGGVKKHHHKRHEHD